MPATGDLKRDFSASATLRHGPPCGLALLYALGGRYIHKLCECIRESRTPRAGLAAGFSLAGCTPLPPAINSRWADIRMPRSRVSPLSWPAGTGTEPGLPGAVH